MSITEADARAYALVKLARVLKRAGETIITVQEPPGPHGMIDTAGGRELLMLWFHLMRLLGPLADDHDPSPSFDKVVKVERLLQAGVIETLVFIITHFSSLTDHYDPREIVSEADLPVWYNALCALSLFSKGLRRYELFSPDIWAPASHKWCQSGDDLIRAFSKNPYLRMLDRPGEHKLEKHRHRAMHTLEPVLGLGTTLASPSIETLKAALPFLAAVRMTIQTPPESKEERWFATSSAQYMSLAIFRIQSDGNHNPRHLMGGSSYELINPCCQCIVNGPRSLHDDLLQIHLVALIAYSDDCQTDWLDKVLDYRIVSLSASLLNRVAEDPVAFHCRKT